MFCRGAHHKRSLENPPGVVLLDIRLPKMDGWEVLRQIRQDPRTCSIPVVMLSGSLFAVELQRGNNWERLVVFPSRSNSTDFLICSRTPGLHGQSSARIRRIKSNRPRKRVQFHEALVP